MSAANGGISVADRLGSQLLCTTLCVSGKRDFLLRRGGIALSVYDAELN
jgi:hypothetical protein